MTSPFNVGGKSHLPAI